MRLTKMLGLGMAAAIAVLALVGASSAMAEGTTALCQKSETTCASPFKGTITGKAIKTPTLLGTFFGIKGSITCEKSEVSGSDTEGRGTPLKGSITSITFEGNCKDSTGGTCTVKTVALGSLDLLKTATKNTAIATSLGNNVEVVCKGGLISVNCVFGGEPKLTAVGSPTKTLTANEAELKAVSGSACPTSPKWDATYEIVAPAGELFITA